MKTDIFISARILIIPLMVLCCCYSYGQHTNRQTLFTHATIITGLDEPPLVNNDMLIENGIIQQIGPDLTQNGANVLNLQGKTVMPLLTSAHSHIGIVKGTTNGAQNYTVANIQNQLNRYLEFGVGNILTMGTDRPFIFTSGLKDSSSAGLLPGARWHTTGMGFSAPNSAPPASMGADLVFRPSTEQQVKAEMDTLASLKPDLVKIWVDDFVGKSQKMNEAVYCSIIKEAHRHNLRVAAHLYYLSDARKLVAAGVDIIAHSIRDSVIDESLISEMKARGVAYIPTLALEEYAFAYAEKPDWMKEPFFKASLEPGVFEMISSESYQKALKDATTYHKNTLAFKIAMMNLKRLFEAGVLIALGTDSGALPVRAQGFSEHLELELMVQAGLTPLQAITVATKNSAEVLKINEYFGTLQKGKSADLLILNDNPANNINNTQKIVAVYKAGKLVSHGPIKK